jgi:glutamine synthetase
LPANINDAIRIFRGSAYTTKILGETTKDKYLEFKQASANRNSRDLGKTIKAAEILYHHEVTNQFLWNQF